MALGPNEITENRKPIIDAAEKSIDMIIEKSNSTPIFIDPKILKITMSEWNSVLAPKYRTAGWMTAEWTNDQREGSLITLDVKPSINIARDYWNK